MSNTWWADKKAELVDYAFPAPWRPMAIFLDLIQKKFITVDPDTAVVTQLRDFKHGGDLERPVIISPFRRKNGYYYIRIQVGGFDVNDHRTPRLTVTVKLPRLVWCSVHGPIPSSIDVDHKKGDKSKNGISDLQALTKQRHIEKNKQTGVYLNSSNEPQIPEDDPRVLKIRELVAQNISVRKIAKEVGLPPTTCHRIMTGKYRFKQ